MSSSDSDSSSSSTSSSSSSDSESDEDKRKKSKKKKDRKKSKKHSKKHKKKKKSKKSKKDSKKKSQEPKRKRHDSDDESEQPLKKITLPPLERPATDGIVQQNGSVNSAQAFLATLANDPTTQSAFQQQVQQQNLQNGVVGSQIESIVVKQEASSNTNAAASNNSSSGSGSQSTTVSSSNASVSSLVSNAAVSMNANANSQQSSSALTQTQAPAVLVPAKKRTTPMMTLEEWREFQKSRPELTRAVQPIKAPKLGPGSGSATGAPGKPKVEEGAWVCLSQDCYAQRGAVHNPRNRNTCQKCGALKR